MDTFDKNYRRWARGLLAAVLALLSVCAGIVYAVDPCLYYRMPENWEPVFFNERYQSAGMIQHIPAETVLMGTSMVANIRPSAAAEAFDSTALRITIPDGYFSEFDQAADLLFRTRSPKRLVFCLDMNTLIRDPSGVTGAMPAYLYDRNPFNDAEYLLNKDTLYYSLYVLLANGWGGGQSVDESFLWNDGTVWERYEALRTYRRPDLSETVQPADAYLANADANLSVLTGWFQAHPDTEFIVYFAPYSILAWDRAIRRGELDARFAALERACETLTAYENVSLYAPLFDREIVENLDNYCDYIHHSGDAGRLVLQKIAAGEHPITADNYASVLSGWRQFVTGYDYLSIWDDDFFARWNATHDAPPVWWGNP